VVVVIDVEVDVGIDVVVEVDVGGVVVVVGSVVVVSIVVMVGSSSSGLSLGHASKIKIADTIVKRNSFEMLVMFLFSFIFNAQGTIHNAQFGFADSKPPFLIES
jgi:hypothetical protein